MKKKLLTLIVMLTMISVASFAQFKPGAVLIQASDTPNRPMPLEVSDFFTAATFPDNTYGRLMRLSRANYQMFYDIGITKNNVFFINRGKGVEPMITINPTSQVGIGTTDAPHKLTVYGSGTNDGVISIQSGTNSRFLLQANTNTFNIGGTALGTGAINITSGGNVGIGTTDPKDYKLAVNGTGIFTKVIVKNYANWPDYVFSDAYKLPSLEETAQYIDQHKHLPGIPAASEMESADGMDIADMNRRLLQKVEELTLYLIEEHKKVQQLEAEVAAMKK